MMILVRPGIKSRLTSYIQSMDRYMSVVCLVMLDTVNVGLIVR